MGDAESAPRKGSGVSTDDLFDALSHARRRAVLSYLHDADGDVVALSELVDWVTAREADRKGDQREVVAVTLHHNHLPKLAVSGLIDYEYRNEIVRYHGQSADDQERTLVGDIVGELP